jgi:nucleoside triphosphate diphosphatase
MSKPIPSRNIADLIAIMAALRHPTEGCPWDVEQTFATIAPYTVEEAYEVQDAALRGDMADLCEELGDLLLQVVFHARMAEEAEQFAFGDVVEAITRKLIRRHPHVFGDARHLSPDQVKALWAAIKAEEKREKRARPGLDAPVEGSVLAGIGAGLPPAKRAVRLQAAAARVGFDWPEPGHVVDKMREEVGEIAEAVAGGDKAAIADEIGDLLFVTANLARWFDIDPDTAMAKANRKFTRRFNFVEQELAKTGVSPSESTLAEMDALWNEAKQAERR